ncbi:class I SAM-dependent methyltransferase [Actinoplanes sp. URMC 104]|uniref:class I SAM-dependent methyltransferase n=1 Tax=Actinoplanes sp. URMC 104 TaxID=3423409 RepID=UPI003F1C86AE
MTRPSARAVDQYASTTANLSARIAIYEHSTDPQSWYAWLGERLRLSGAVLEVGAGTGALWTHVRHDGIRLTLADFSSAMCERLRAVPGAAVVRADAGRLPFAAGVFDGLVANHMLYHLDDPRVALREFARVLRPGGRLAVALNGAEHLAELAALGSAVGRPDLRPAPDHTVTAESAAAYIGELFGDVRAERCPGTLEIPAAEPVLAYLASLGRAPLTADQEAAVRDHVARRVAADGAFRVRRHTVLLTATR